MLTYNNVSEFCFLTFIDFRHYFSVCLLAEFVASKIRKAGISDSLLSREVA